MNKDKDIENKELGDINREKIIIYKTNNCSFHNNYIYCENIQKHILNSYEKNNTNNSNIINGNTKYKENNEMEKILCYTY